MNSKLARLNESLAHPRRTGDLHIYFMEIMEQIEFSSNDMATRNAFIDLFEKWGNYWFPNEHKVDLYDRIYADTLELVA
jgi:hypothetical protein